MVDNISEVFLTEYTILDYLPCFTSFSTTVLFNMFFCIRCCVNILDAFFLLVLDNTENDYTNRALCLFNLIILNYKSTLTYL